MRQTANATVLLWLRDAHGLESQSVQMLTSQLPSLRAFRIFIGASKGMRRSPASSATGSRAASLSWAKPVVIPRRAWHDAWPDSADDDLAAARQCGPQCGHELCL
jgi:hypothetical protein